MSLETQLEEAESKGHKQGMADLLAILSAADTGQLYSPQAGYQDDNKSSYFRARLSAAMLTAAKQNQVELVGQLLKAGADANTLTASGHNDNTCDYSGTVLHDAAKAGYTEVVQVLLDAGADPNPYYEHTDSSPLKSAVSGGHTEIVRALLSAKADVRQLDQPEESEWLIDYEAAGDHVEMTKALLKFKAHIGPYENSSWTPLMDAGCHGKTESAALLIEAGSDVNATDTEFNTFSVLMIAAIQGDVLLDAIRLLLNYKVEINYKSEDGYTALICAAAAGGSEAVHLLLSAGANIFSRAQGRESINKEPARKAGNAFDLATDDAVREILRSEMHKRIAAALSVLPAIPVGVCQKIIQLFIEN